MHFVNLSRNDVHCSCHPRREAERIVVIGSGTRFFSGISKYTHALACALSPRHHTTVILMRRLLPRRLYPGAKRVGEPIAHHVYPDDIQVYDGVDWFWLPSLFGALRLMWGDRPSIVVFQWWTAAVAHTYLILMVAARLRGARIMLEMHEVQDTGEARVPFATPYARRLLRLMVPLIDGYVTHSENDREVLVTSHPVADKPIEVIRHGPFDHYAPPSGDVFREAPANALNIMFFGTIRPYKGLEDLIRAFDNLPDPAQFWLTVVGETWEGWTLPSKLISASPHTDRITFVNHYVTEEDAARWLAGADALALPYHRSSASGPLHVGMALGLPIVTTDIPALVDAAASYEGCSFVAPRDIDQLRDALLALETQRGQRYRDPGSWQETVCRFERLIAASRGEAR